MRARDVVTARCDYSKLDRAGNPVRIRLNSLVVRARNDKDGVEIAYTRASGGAAVKRVRARHCVLASWNMMIPYLCPEMPTEQKEALHDIVKAPLIYTNVALRNWQSFVKLKVDRVYAPGCYWVDFGLNAPVDIGNYKSPRDPSEPILIRMTRTPASINRRAPSAQASGSREPAAGAKPRCRAPDPCAPACAGPSR